MSIIEIIARRKTEKFLANPSSPRPVNLQSIDLSEIIEAARWAPFHRPCHASHRESGTLHSNLPYRLYVLDAAQCRNTLKRLTSAPQQDSHYGDLPALGKIPAMLAAAEALIVVSWLPNPAKDEILPFGAYEASHENMEHIAAASAAIQNMLLTATAREIPNYWSSGGAIFRSRQVYDLLGMPHDQILLGSIFLFPDCTTEVEGIQRVPGKLRDMRGGQKDFACHVSLD